MPVTCIEHKDFEEGNTATKEKPKPKLPKQAEKPPEPKPQEPAPQQQEQRAERPQPHRVESPRVPTSRIARETLRRVTDGNYSDQDREQVRELAGRVGEEGHRQAANRLQHAVTHRDQNTAAGQAERGTRRYLRDIGQIRDDSNRGGVGTASQEQIRQPAPDEVDVRGRESRQERSKEDDLQTERQSEREQLSPEQRRQRDEDKFNLEFEDEPENDERVYDVAELQEPEDQIQVREEFDVDEPDLSEERQVFNQDAADFGFADPEDGGDAGDAAAEIGIETPKTFQFLRDLGVENKETLDSIGGGSALDGAQTVLHEVTKNSADISIKHKYIKRCDRSIRVDHDGNRYMVNEYFRVRKDAPKGVGLRVFEDQVKTAIENGFSYIETVAAGNKQSAAEGDYNGYITWAKFGYDQEKDAFLRNEELIEQWEKDWPEAESVQDIMAQEGGAEWWAEHGQSMNQAVFDLTEGSRSRYILEEYIAAKKKAGQYIEGLIKSYFKKSLAQDNGAEPISMDEANDPVLNQIHTSLGKGMKQPGVPFQGPSGRWFVVRPQDNKVVPTADPNAAPDKEEYTPQEDEQFAQDWAQISEQEIAENDTQNYVYSAEEVAAEQDWHRQVIEWRGSGGEPQPQEAGVISRAVSGLLNPAVGVVGYVDGLVREFQIPLAEDDITQGLLAELDRVNPGGAANAIIAALVGWLFGSPAIEVVSKMPEQGVEETPQVEESQQQPEPEQPPDPNDPRAGIKEKLATDPEFKKQWEHQQKKIATLKKKAALKQQRLDAMTPDERAERARMAFEKLQKKEGRRQKRGLQQWRGQLKRGEVTPQEILADRELLSRYPELKEAAERKLNKKGMVVNYSMKVMQSPFIKGRGQPCKRGETARATGCIPKSKIGGSKKPTSPKTKPRTQSKIKPSTDESVNDAKKAIASGDSDAINKLVSNIQASTGKKGIAVAGLQKIAKQLGIAPGKLKKQGLVLSIIDKLKVSRPANDLQRRLDTIKRAEKGYGISFTDRLISAAIGAPSQSPLSPNEKEAYRNADTSKPEGRTLVTAIRRNVLERLLDASEPISQSLLDGLGVEGYGFLAANEVVPYLKGELKPHDPTVPKEGEVLPEEFKILSIKGGTKKAEVSKRQKEDYLDRLLKESPEERLDYVKRAEQGEGISFLDRLVSGYIFNPKTGATLDTANRIKYADLVKRTCAGCPSPFYDESEKKFVREFREKAKRVALSEDQQGNTAVILEQLSNQGFGSLRVNELGML